MEKYGYLFDSGLSEQEIEFDKLIIDINESNKDIVIPMLLKLAVHHEQKAKLKEACDRMMFDIVSLEAGVSPDPEIQSIN